MKTDAFALTPAERDKLVRDHLNLVRAIAANIQKRFNLPVDLDELVSDGHAGLVDAVNRFNPAEAGSFSTYAGYRIRGAILDAIRKMTFLPRKVYYKVREAATSNDYLQSVADAPTPKEAQSLEARADRVENAVAGVATVVMLAIEGISDDEMVAAGDIDRAEGEGVDPVLRRHLSAAMARLKPDERDFLRRVYVDDQSFADVAREMKRSRSWVTRLHQGVIAKLRDALGPLENDG